MTYPVSVGTRVPGSTTSPRRRTSASVGGRPAQASARIASLRAGGASGSNGRYPAPVRSTARIATIASTPRGRHTVTSRPAPAPSARSCPARRRTAASSSA
ncbi:hypothetical protein GCM10012279_28880 [Micromonospora yangpuensis]|nr:hypothetical protein GCM10012279_28880 [Micromonospora yangpuensis]